MKYNVGIGYVDQHRDSFEVVPVPELPGVADETLQYANAVHVFNAIHSALRVISTAGDISMILAEERLSSSELQTTLRSYNKSGKRVARDEELAGGVLRLTHVYSPLISS